MPKTNRDIELKITINKFGYLTSKQTAKYCGISLKVAQRLLRRLARKDYLKAIPLPSKTGRSPYLYILGTRGVQLLGVKQSRPRLTLNQNHLLLNIDILLEILVYFKSTEMHCDILPESTIRRSNQHINPIPDGAFMLSRNDKVALFLIETDSGTEILKSKSDTHDDIQGKFFRYTEIFEGNHVEFYEHYFSQKLTRFRTLFIFQNLTRLKTVSKLLSDKSHHFIWLTTLDELYTHGIAGNIWKVPALKQTGKSII